MPESWQLDGVKLFEMKFGMADAPEPPRAPMKVTTQVPAPGFEDMDWTEPCLERGTTFTVTGVVNAEKVPVEKAWVKDEVLYMQGTVAF